MNEGGISIEGIVHGGRTDGVLKRGLRTRERGLSTGDYPRGEYPRGEYPRGDYHRGTIHGVDYPPEDYPWNIAVYHGASKCQLDVTQVSCSQ